MAEDDRFFMLLNKLRREPLPEYIFESYFRLKEDWNDIPVGTKLYISDVYENRLYTPKTYDSGFELFLKYINDEKVVTIIITEAQLYHLTKISTLENVKFNVEVKK